jgi:inhibitor of cysteine peptidase
MPDLTLTQNDNGRSIPVPVGAVIHIDLPENPTTGYRWSLRASDKQSMALESENYTPAESSGVGGGGTRHFLFRAKAPGTATLVLKNMRQWEPEEKAVSTFCVRLIVA